MRSRDRKARSRPERPNKLSEHVMWLIGLWVQSTDNLLDQTGSASEWVSRCPNFSFPYSSHMLTQTNATQCGQIGVLCSIRKLCQSCMNDFCAGRLRQSSSFLRARVYAQKARCDGDSFWLILSGSTPPFRFLLLSKGCTDASFFIYSN